MDLSLIKTRDEAFDLLDGYAEERKADLSQRHTRRPLVKSYLLETAPHEHVETDVNVIFGKAGCSLKPLDEALFRIFDENKGEYVGLLEKLINRHPVIYTTNNSDVMDPWIKKLVASSPALDHLWLSGRAFEELLEIVFRRTPEHRYIKLAFQHENFYESNMESTPNLMEYQEEEEEDALSIVNSFTNELDDDYVPERRKTTFTLTDRLSVIKKLMPEMRNYYTPVHSITLLRFPSLTRSGGHDFYYNGKVTNRSNSFTDHRQHLEFVLKIYKRAIEATEQMAWQHTEKTTIATASQVQPLIGAPVLIKFSEPLSQSVFDNFITNTFHRNPNRFRLWGNPIQLGPRKVHVYGIDRHLWQQIFLEITERQIVAILPRGTCGNTVHRLVTNVQQFLDPGVQVWVGDKEYSDLIKVEPDIRSIYDDHKT